MNDSTPRYVCGFLFRNNGVEVALIRKNKPQWQAGKLNGIGGKIEPGETPYSAMVREFQEETGALVTNWKPFCSLTVEEGHATVHFFVCAGGEHVELKSTTDEEVSWWQAQDMEGALTNVSPGKPEQRQDSFRPLRPPLTKKVHLRA